MGEPSVSNRCKASWVASSPAALSWSWRCSSNVSSERSKETVIWMVTVVSVRSTISADMMDLLLGETEELTISSRMAKVYIVCRSHPWRLLQAAIIVNADLYDKYHAFIR